MKKQKAQGWSEMERRTGNQTQKNRRASSASSCASSVSSTGRGTLVWKKKEEDRQQWLKEQEDIPNHLKLKAAKLGALEKEKPIEAEEDQLETFEKGSSMKQETLEKGCSMEQETLEKGESMKQEPLEKGSAASSSPGGKTKKKIMVDFHNTLSVNDYEIPPANHQAMETLINLGYSITICSWCFKKREREVMETLRKQPWFPKLEDAYCIRERTGPLGKAARCLAANITVLFDDAQDICSEAISEGVEAYPIMSRKEKHIWFENMGHRPWMSFSEAVASFLGKEMHADV